MIDVDGFTVRMAGQPVEVTATEFRLLVELARHPGRVLRRDALLHTVWGYDYLGQSRLVDMTIRRLREKLGDNAHPRYVTAVRGVGYRLRTTVRPGTLVLVTALTWRTGAR